MWLRDSAEKFMSDGSYSANLRKTNLQGLNRLALAEEQNGKPIYQFSESEMTHTFRAITASQRTRQLLRTLTDKYFDWLFTQGVDATKGKKSLGVLDIKTLERERTKLYFYGIYQLLRKMHYDIEYVAKQEGRMQADYRMVKAAFILLWVGLPIGEAIDVTKQDVLLENGVVTHNGKRYTVDSEAYAILRECARATFYTRNTATANFDVEYAPGKYLFRTATSEQMPLSTLKQYVTNLNAALHPQSSPYKIEKIYWSGVFYRAYEAETHRGGIKDLRTLADKLPVFQPLFGEEYRDIQGFQSRFREYMVYTSVFRDRK